MPTTYYVGLFMPKVIQIAPTGIGEGASLTYEFVRGDELIPATGYTRQAGSFSDSDPGFRSLIGTVTFAGPSATPAFAPPSDHPNTWVVSYIGLCSGGVAGADDVLYETQLGSWLGVGSPKDLTLIPGESLVFDPDTIQVDSGILSTVLRISPVRGFGSTAPCNDACFQRLLKTYMVAWATWAERVIMENDPFLPDDLEAARELSMTPNPVKIAAGFEQYAIHQGYASVAARATACGCP